MKRVRSTAVTSPGLQDQLTFNESSFSRRTLLVGPVIDVILGPCLTATYVGKYKTIYIVNTTAAVVYVKLGDKTVAAGTSISDSIALLPSTVAYLGTGESEYLISSAAGVGYYTIKEDITIE